MTAPSAALSTPADQSIRSCTGKTWYATEISMRDIYHMQQQTALPELLCRLLCSRKVTDVAGFLQPKLRDSLPDPLHLRDMDRAIERIMRALDGKESIMLLGDYDVDGATSTALLLQFFTAIGHSRIGYHIPDRILEGYGPSVQAMERFHAEGATLVITLDCGTLAFEPIARAKALGMDVIVVDHHASSGQLPEAHAIVNPNRMDQAESTARHMAAVGVAFLLLVGLAARLRTHPDYAGRVPDLMGYLDLVALGTVCDVMPLTGVNRSIVSQGLKILNGRKNQGLQVLMEVARLTEAPSTYHLGFALGPRINAGGRVGESSLGVRLLTASSRLEAEPIAMQLDLYNQERGRIEALILEEAIAKAELLVKDHGFLCVAGEGWHAGVIGIVASRLKDRFHRPVAVIAVNDGIGKASARSIHGFDMGMAVMNAQAQGVLLSAGGHAMAAGFTIDMQHFDAFSLYMNNQLTPLGLSLEPRLHYDATLLLASITTELVHSMERLSPFGMGNPEPRILLPNVRIRQADVVGNNSIRVRLSDESNASQWAIAFRAADQWLGQCIMGLMHRPIHVLCKIQMNRWNGTEKPSIVIEDIAEVTG